MGDTLTLEMSKFLTHLAETGEWNLEDPIVISSETIRDAEDRKYVRVSRWRGRYASAELTALGRSKASWFVRARFSTSVLALGQRR